MREPMRLDAVLVQQGYASGREKAKELIKAGTVTVGGKPAVKPSQTVWPEDAVVCTAEPPRYVGRGGEKLEKAITAGGADPTGAIALDVGASTGGFTDCLLQHGARSVYAVDVGHGQLHPRLRADDRVVCLEGTDSRDPALREIIKPGSVSFVTVDVSFISLHAVLPSVMPFLAPDSTVVCLIKPQFEAGRAALGKNGLCRDPRDHRRVLQTVLTLFASLHLRTDWLSFSPVTGGEGNIEYLAVLRTAADAAVTVPVEPVITEAFAQLKNEVIRL